MSRILLSLVLLAGAAGGCGGPVARETGNLQGHWSWSGHWPTDGYLVAALFDVPPWDPAFEPGPPAAFAPLTEPDGFELTFSLSSTGVRFGTYGALVVAWQDPEAVEESARMRPLSVYGTSLQQMEQAAEVVLSEAEPDLLLELPAAELFASGAEMRQHYPPVDY